MLISHSNKFIFIKTKKTAGSSVESIIVENFFDKSKDICTGSKIDGTPRVNIGDKKPNEPDGHKPWHMVAKIAGDDNWANYTTFTVERNPWDKAVSEFYWKFAREPKMSKYNNDKDNFKYFIENIFGKWYTAPVDWDLYGQGSELKVDQVLQYSTLAADLSQLLQQHGLDANKEMVESTRKKSGYRRAHYTEMYDARLIDIISRWYQNEINQFGYKFGD
jgi:hypothetical protein